MKLFHAVATDKAGKKYAGTFEAPSREAALQMLKAQGYVPVTLDEIETGGAERETTPFANVKPKAVPQEEEKGPNWGKAVIREKGKRSSGIAVPLAAGIAALVAIPLIILPFGPGKPKGKPEDVLREYYGHEFAGAYEKQVPLLSKKMRKLAGNPGEYARKRKEEIQKAVSEAAAADAEKAGEEEQVPEEKAAPSLEDVKVLGKKALSAEVVAFVSLGEDQEQTFFGLVAEDRKWKIDEVRKLQVVAHATRRQREKAPEQAAAREKTPQAPADLSVMKKEAMSMLEKARGAGTITEEEYQLKKKQIEAV